MENNSLYECYICLSLMIEPIKIKCSHILCLTCLEQLIINNNLKCPMDRKEFKIDKDLSYDYDIFQKNFSSFPDEVFDKISKLIKLREGSKSMIPMQITYGNYHEKKQGIDYIGNQHFWKCFVKLEKSTGKISKTLENLKNSSPIYTIIGKVQQEKEPEEEVNAYKNLNENTVIKKVIFNLHPTFQPPRVQVSHFPFEINRLGWGVFNIVIEIEFTDSLGMDKLELDHMLSFSSPLTVKHREIFIDKAKLAISE